MNNPSGNRRFGIACCMLPLITLLINTVFPACGQERKTLSVGDTLPDSIWNSPLLFVDMDGKERTIRLSDFEDSLLIIDFWATWCGSCIAGFPKNVELQRKFEGKLEFLLVNSGEDVAKVANFLVKRPSLNTLRGSVIKAEHLRDLFPYNTIPHYVWLSNQKVVAITKGAHVKEKHILSVLSSESPFIPQAQQSVVLDIFRPMFVDGNGEPPKRYDYRSFATGYVEGVKDMNAFRKKSKDTVTGYFHVNRGLKSLYLAANPELMGIGSHRVVYETKRPEYFVPYGDKDEWWEKHLVTYDLLCPPVHIDRARAMMRADLERYFNYHFYADQRRVECLVLSIPAITALRSKPPEGRSRETNVNDLLGDAKYLYGHPLRPLVLALGNRYGMPVFDESGFEGNLYLDLPADLTDEQQLVDSLLSQGIVLKREMRDIEVLVIADR